MKRTLFIAWDVIHVAFLVLRFTSLCVILLCRNHSFGYLLPAAVALDWIVFRYSFQKVYISQFKLLEKNIRILQKGGTLLVSVKNEIIDTIYDEIKKYQFFKWGNKNGDKDIIVLQSDKLIGQYISIPLYNGISIVIVPKTFYPQHYSDRLRLAHEFSHCLSHDLMILLRKSFKLTIIIYSLISVFINGFGLLSILTILASFYAYLSQGWFLPYIEIEANDNALQVVGRLFGKEEQRKAAELLHDNLSVELQRENDNSHPRSAYRKAVLVLQLNFLDDFLKTGRLISQISPINKNVSLSYWILFALVGYSCISLTETVVISWYIIGLAPVMYFLYVAIQRKINMKLWRKKTEILQRLGNI